MSTLEGLWPYLVSLFLLSSLEGGKVGALSIYYIIYKFINYILSIKTSTMEDESEVNVEPLEMGYSFRPRRVSLRSSRLKWNEKRRKGPKNYNLSRRTTRRPTRKPTREEPSWYHTIIGIFGIKRKIPITGKEKPNKTRAKKRKFERKWKRK
jgi:hypothetical protein